MHVWCIEVGSPCGLATPLFDDQQDVRTRRCLHADAGGSLEGAAIAATSDSGADEGLECAEVLDEQRAFCASHALERRVGQRQVEHEGITAGLGESASRLCRGSLL